MYKFEAFMFAVLSINYIVNSVHQPFTVVSNISIMVEVTGDKVLFVNIMSRTDIYICVQILILVFILG